MIFSIFLSKVKIMSDKHIVNQCFIYKIKTKFFTLANIKNFVY